MIRQRPQIALGAGDFRRSARGKHGLSRAELDLILRRQGGRCLICGRSIEAIGLAHVDHSHKLAATHPHPIDRGCRLCIRGLICRDDNLILGHAADDPERLRRAAAYLEAGAV